MSAALHISDISALLKKAEREYKQHLVEFGIEDPTIIVNNSGGKDSGATDLIAKYITGGNYRSVAADTGNEHPLTIEHLKALHLQPNRGGQPVEIVTANYSQELFTKRSATVNKAWMKKQKVMAGAYRGVMMPSLGRADTKFAEIWRNAMSALGLPAYDTPLHAFNATFVKSGNPFLDMCLIHGGFPLGRSRYCTDELKIEAVYNQVLAPLLDAGEEVIQFSGVRGDESDKRATYPEFAADKRDPDYLYNFLPIKNWTASDVFAL